MFDKDEDWVERKNNFSEYDKNNPKRLFKDRNIEWHCDDYPYDIAGTFIIEKLDECYKLTFNKCKVDSIYALYSVRIRNSGSRYGCFNVIFMRMYNKLCDYQSNFHQIHIEEYMYYKRLTKIKKTI